MRFIFLFIFLISTSFALSIDKSWYENATKEGLEKIYTDQTKKITSSKNNLSPEDKEQVEYQLLLLKKLQSVIKEENTFIFNTIEEITSIETYIEQVKEYLKNASYYYPNWDQKMADELIEKFELNTKQRINKMSKGMLSMVTIIVALASKADFTFLDEPVAGLDVVMREYFYHKLMEEYTETGIRQLKRD